MYGMLVFVSSCISPRTTNATRLGTHIPAKLAVPG